MVLVIAVGMNGGRLVGELSPHHRCHNLKGAAHTTRHRPPSLDVSWRLLFSDTKTFQIPNANFCYALFGLRRGLGTIGTQDIHWQFMTLISATSLGWPAPNPEETESEFTDPVDPKPLQRHRSQFGTCPL